jgi:hypothetical protein
MLDFQSVPMLHSQIQESTHLQLMLAWTTF